MSQKYQTIRYITPYLLIFLASVGYAQKAELHLTYEVHGAKDCEIDYVKRISYANQHKIPTVQLFESVAFDEADFKSSMLLRAEANLLSYTIALGIEDTLAYQYGHFVVEKTMVQVDNSSFQETLTLLGHFHNTPIELEILTGLEEQATKALKALAARVTLVVESIEKLNPNKASNASLWESQRELTRLLQKDIAPQNYNRANHVQVKDWLYDINEQLSALFRETEEYLNALREKAKEEPASLWNLDDEDNRRIALLKNQLPASIASWAESILLRDKFMIKNLKTILDALFDRFEGDQFVIYFNVGRKHLPYIISDLSDYEDRLKIITKKCGN